MTPAPERTLASGTLLDEAMRIRDLLVPEVVAEQIAFGIERDRRLSDMRERLGYLSVSTDNDAGLIDTRNTKDLLVPPDAVAAILPVSEESADTTRDSRAAIGDILTGQDDRLVVIVGPCSIHDPEAALEYAENVAQWRAEYGSNLEIVMRAYMEKPRTELGWKGMIYQPHPDETEDINTGVIVARMLAAQITHSGVPIAMERLNASTPQYVNGLVAYDAIGARNTEDQKAREYASGTSSPVGIKNTTDGNIMTAAQAIVTANGPHSFMGIAMNGLPAQVNTTGNPLAHLILRGGSRGPNYSAEHIDEAKGILRSKKLLEAIVVDASHGNSVGEDGKKNHLLQEVVVEDVARQVIDGETTIKGVMIEGNIIGGKQTYEPGREMLYGQSKTDACVDLNQAAIMLTALAEAVQMRRSA